jgi:hypothetical protein
MGGRPWWLALGVACVTLLGGGGLLLARWPREVSEVPPPARCVDGGDLIPRTRSGLPWQRSRRLLDPVPGDRGPYGFYVVQNLRTGQTFRWGHRSQFDGRRVVLVPTRYAVLVNRGWASDPWRYCFTPPGWPRDTDGHRPEHTPAARSPSVHVDRPARQRAP